MRKLVLLFLSAVCALSVLCFAGCQSDPTLSINVAALSGYAEAGEPFTVTLPSIIDENGVAYGEYNVKIVGVKDASGTAVNCSMNRFVPNKVGKYTVTFACSNADGIAEAVWEVECKDTKAPVVSVENMKTDAIKGEKIAVPTFTSYDVSGIDYEKSKVVLTDAENNVIEPVDGYYTLSEAGEYTYTATTYDVFGNVTETPYTLIVSDVEVVKDKIIYFDTEIATRQAQIFPSWANYQEMAFSADTKTPEGNGALKLSNVMSCNQGLVCTSYITDWRGYDYIGFWYFNDNDFQVKVWIAAEGNFYYNAVICPSRQWQFVAFPTNLSFINYNESKQENDCVKEFVIIVTTALSANAISEESRMPEGAVSYFGAIKGGRFTEDESALLRYDELGGVCVLGFASSYIQKQTYVYTTEHHEENAAGSLLYTAVTDHSIISRARLLPEYYYQFSKLTAWVKNLNDFDIKVTDGSGNSTVVGAASEKRVPVAIATNQELQLVVSKSDGTELPAGAKFCLGSVKGIRDTSIKSISPDEAVYPETVDGVRTGTLISNLSEAYIISDCTSTSKLTAVDKKVSGLDVVAQIEITNNFPLQSTIELTPENKDWSSYDYVGFWVYNGKLDAIGFRPFYNIYYEVEIPAQSWRFVAINIKKMPFESTALPAGVTDIVNISISDVDYSNVEKIAFRFNQKSYYLKGDFIYLTSLCGYNYENAAEDAVIRLDDVGGQAELGIAASSLVKTAAVAHSSEIHCEGENGSAEVTFLKETNGYFLRIQKWFFAGSEYDYYTGKVFNPTTKEFVLNGTVLTPGEWTEVTYNLSDASQAYGPRLSLEFSGSFAVGDKINLGAIYGKINPEPVVVENELAVYTNFRNNVQGYSEMNAVKETIDGYDVRLKINVVAPCNQSSLDIVPEVSNWSKYDYVGFWFYNSKSEAIKLTPWDNRNDYHVLEIPAHSWKFVSFDIHKLKLNDVALNIADINNVAKFSWQMQFVSAKHVSGDYFYLTALKGYNYKNTGATLHFDDLGGQGAISMTNSAQIGTCRVDYAEEKLSDNDNGSTMVTLLKATNLFGLRIQKFFFVGIEAYDHFEGSVKNATQHDVTVNGVTLAAGETKVLTFNYADVTQSYGPRMAIDMTGEFAVGDKLYFGAVYGKMKDNNVVKTIVLPSVDAFKPYQTYQSITYNSEIVCPDQSTGVAVLAQSQAKYLSALVIPTEKNFKQFTYFSFWYYNKCDAQVTLYVSANGSYRPAQTKYKCAANSWTLIAISTEDVLWIDGVRDMSNVTSFCIMTDNNTPLEAQGYVSAITGYSNDNIFVPENTGKVFVYATAMQSIAYASDVKDHDGNDGVLKETLSTKGYYAFVVSPTIRNITIYDKIGFWFYNGSATAVNLFISAEKSYRPDSTKTACAANSWTYVEFSTSLSLWADGDVDSNNLSCFYIMSENILAAGDYCLLGDIKGVNV